MVWHDFQLSMKANLNLTLLPASSFLTQVKPTCRPTLGFCFWKMKFGHMDNEHFQKFRCIITLLTIPPWRLMICRMVTYRSFLRDGFSFYYGISSPGLCALLQVVAWSYKGPLMMLWGFSTAQSRCTVMLFVVLRVRTPPIPAFSHSSGSSSRGTLLRLKTSSRLLGFITIHGTWPLQTGPSTTSLKGSNSPFITLTTVMLGHTGVGWGRPRKWLRQRCLS